MTITMSKPFVTALLAVFYVIAFVLSPYWLLAESPAGMIAILSATILLGAAWSYVSAGELRFRLDASSWFSFAFLLAGLAILNYRALTSVIPWRGDEGGHIARTLGIAAAIPARWVAGELAGFGFFLYAAWRNAKWAIPIWILQIGSIVLFYLSSGPFEGFRPTFLLRYPFVNYWLLALAPKLALLIGDPYHEILYRVIPFLFFALLLWAILESWRPAKTLERALWVLAAATVPVLFYYSSILYIEPPAVFLMMVVCLRIKDLLHEDVHELKRNPAWYALILTGFIKETTIVFLLSVIACRVGIALLSGRPSDRQPGKTGAGRLAGELNFIFSALLPCLLYLFLRSTFADTRAFTAHLQNLLDPSIYDAIGRSFVQQFGIYLIIFLAGCVWLVRKREYSRASFFLLLVIGFPWFYALDNRLYAGYSRFNLFILPPILAGANILPKRLMGWSRMGAAALACVIITFNLMFSPVHMDGSKVPLWGNYLVDTSEHYYPYQEALAWLKEYHSQDRIMAAGLSYPYYFQFYFEKLDWRPKHKQYEVYLSGNAAAGEAAISEALARAEREGFSVVLYQLPNGGPPPPKVGEFRLETEFSNQAHSLAIYSRIP